MAVALGGVVGVLQCVALQQGAVREGPLADVALEGALGTVGAHVHVEGALLGETLAAHGALERAHARVHHHVLEEVVTQGEGAPADGALVRFLTCSKKLWSISGGIGPGSSLDPPLDLSRIQSGSTPGSKLDSARNRSWI